MKKKPFMYQHYKRSRTKIYNHKTFCRIHDSVSFSDYKFAIKQQVPNHKLCY